VRVARRSDAQPVAHDVLIVGQQLVASQQRVLGELQGQNVLEFADIVGIKPEQGLVLEPAGQVDESFCAEKGEEPLIEDQAGVKRKRRALGRLIFSWSGHVRSFCSSRLLLFAWLSAAVCSLRLL